jgi:hypothetical protein
MPCPIASAAPTPECICALSWSKTALLDSKPLRYLLCAKIFQEISNVLTPSDLHKTIRSHCSTTASSLKKFVNQHNTNNLTLTCCNSSECLVIETATYASIAVPPQANSLYFLINLYRYCQYISTLSLVFPICPLFLFLFYGLVNHGNLPIKFLPFISLRIFNNLCVFIPFHLHFKFDVQKLCCFSICILLFLFIHTTAPLIFCMFVRLFIYRFIYASLSTLFLSVCVCFSIQHTDDPYIHHPCCPSL